MDSLIICGVCGQRRNADDMEYCELDDVLSCNHCGGPVRAFIDGDELVTWSHDKSLLDLPFTIRLIVFETNESRGLVIDRSAFLSGVARGADGIWRIEVPRQRIDSLRRFDADAPDEESLAFLFEQSRYVQSSWAGESIDDVDYWHLKLSHQWPHKGYSMGADPDDWTLLYAGIRLRIRRLRPDDVDIVGFEMTDNA